VHFIETFNFDIIIILVLIASVTAGVYYSLYRQARKTLALVVPFIGLYFLYGLVMGFIQNTPALNDVMNKVFGWIAKFLGLLVYKNIMITGFVGLILYLGMAGIIILIYSFFPITVEKRVLTKTPPFSRVVAGLLGFINGYIIVIILMAVLKPIATIDYDRPLTAVMNETSNVYIPISKLNEIQNANIEKYEKYQAAFDFLGGKQAAAAYGAMAEISDEFQVLNDYFETTMYSQLGTDSQALVDAQLIGTDFVSAFLAEAEGTMVLSAVLTEEADNPEIASISEKLTYLKNNKGYWLFFSEILENDFDTYDFSAISESLSTNSEVIGAEFVGVRERDLFLKRRDDLANFASYFSQFTVLADDAAIADLATYLASFSDLLTDAERLHAYVTAFLATEFTEASPLIETLQSAFGEYSRNQENIGLMNPWMALESRIILSHRNAEWMSAKTWETQPLLKSYMTDTLKGISTGGFGLYHEYFFYAYLAGDATFADGFDATDFASVLSQLETVVANGTMSAEVAVSYVENLFLYPSSVINVLEERGNLSPTLFDDIYAMNHAYLSEELKTLLGD
jgi:hypothetical protein